MPGVVGIGGYLTGGGLSFLSTQYGFACDVSHPMTWFGAICADGHRASSSLRLSCRTELSQISMPRTTRPLHGYERWKQPIRYVISRSFQISSVTSSGLYQVSTCQFALTKGCQHVQFKFMVPLLQRLQSHCTKPL
jgi:hypothetical protein